MTLGISGSPVAFVATPSLFIPFSFTLCLKQIYNANIFRRGKVYFNSQVLKLF